MTTSICIYGSQARRLTDELSDRDVLILAEHLDDVNDERRRWEQAGWNVSFFEHAHFERLIQHRSLFIQHLKLEGSIIRDDEGYLRQRLSSFQAAEYYTDELVNALLPATWEDGICLDYWSSLCLGDILFVSMRNAAILHAANNKIYTFDYGNLIHYVKSEFGLKRTELDALLKLRVIKAAYRSRKECIHLGSTLCTSIIAMQDIRERVLDLPRSDTHRFVPNNYHALRRAELELVRNRDPRELDKIGPSDAAFALWQLVLNPANYPNMRAPSFDTHSFLKGIQGHTLLLEEC